MTAWTSRRTRRWSATTNGRAWTTVLPPSRDGYGIGESVSGQRRLAGGLRLRRRRVAQIENATRVRIEQLVLVGVRELDLVEQLQARRRIPTWVVGAVHHMVDAVVVDRELHAGRVRRHRIGEHALHVGGDRPRQFGGLGILVHAAGLVGQ